MTLQSIHRFWRGKRELDDSRAYVEVHEEGLLLRVDDDFYDCEMTPAQALDLARAILERYGS